MTKIMPPVKTYRRGMFCLGKTCGQHFLPGGMFSLLQRVKSTRPSYEYHTPLLYIEPISELEAVNTHPIKEPACLAAGHSDWALMNTMSK